MSDFCAIWAVLTTLGDRLDAIDGQLQRIVMQTYRPAVPTFSVLSQGASGMFTFCFDTPTPTAADVVQGTLSVSIAGAPAIVVLTDGTAKRVEDAQFVGNQGDTVHVDYSLTDDDGNTSSTASADYVISDTVAPPAPGAPALVVTGEV